LDDPSSSRKNKQWGKEKTKCSYCAKGIHPESSFMKRKIDQMALLLDKNNISLPEGTRKKEVGDRNNQPERGHALMANVSKARALLIDSGASNHMVACKDSFTSLDSDNCISIHMKYDSQISSKGKGNVQIEHGSLKNVLYVPSLASNLLSVYQMKHMGFPKIFVFNHNDVEIS